MLSRSSLPLPHQVHGWTESEYVRWLNEHSEVERIKMVRGVVQEWEKDHEGEGDELVEVLNTILSRK